MDNVVIIIPALNESERIANTISEIRKYTDADIVVVSDGSTDNTADGARASGASVIEHPFNLGYGAALQTGFKYALRHHYEFALHMDADGQHNPYYIPVLVQEVMSGETDVAIGSRFFGGGDYKTSKRKKLGMLLFRSIASVITGQKITDPTSGFQAMNRAAMKFCASEAYPTDFPDADVLIMLHRKGLRFKEVPVKMNQSPEKRSMHGGFIPLYYLFKMLLSIFVTLLRKEK
ncbi:MAG: glycosyltransferase family 2 protein [Nitrospiraceae bacterium]|nr:MAG: glycosyltransferase family 2 protein [Nitrospiraceae bacterium]